MLLDHLEGILNYCRTKVSMGVVEAVNGNIKSLLRRGRGYALLNPPSVDQRRRRSPPFCGVLPPHRRLFSRTPQPV